MSSAIYPPDKDVIDAWCYSEKNYNKRRDLARRQREIILNADAGMFQQICVLNGCFIMFYVNLLFSLFLLFSYGHEVYIQEFPRNKKREKYRDSSHQLEIFGIPIKVLLYDESFSSPPPDVPSVIKVVRIPHLCPLRLFVKYFV